MTLIALGACTDGSSPIETGPPDNPDPRPDILVAVADDMRWDLMSARGHPLLNTPNLDTFAAEAAMMNNAFVPVAICSPSRAAILTGREPHLASAPRILWRNNSFLNTQRTFPEDLQAAGYRTAYFGKWHLGDGATPKRGFDHWESFDWLGEFFDPEIVVNGQKLPFKGYVDDILAERVTGWIKANRNRPEPLFVMVGLKAPHLAFEHPRRHNTAFEGVGIPKPDTYDEDFCVSGKQKLHKDWLGINNFRCGLQCFDNQWDTYIKSHYRAILGLDDTIGSLRAAIDYRYKPDNTLFMYTSDNGYSLGDHGLTEKHLVYEEPIRVPLMVDFPGQDDAGVRRDELVSTMDIAPTALDYAGVPIPSGMRGRSLRALVETEGTVKEWRDELFLTYEKKQVAVRTDRYKYIESLDEPGHIELYDLVADPFETRSVSADPSYADTLAEMQQRLVRMSVESRWSPRTLYPVSSIMVSQPVPTGQADSLARKASLSVVPGVEDLQGTNPVTDSPDPGSATVRLAPVPGLDWQPSQRGDNGRFDLAAGPDESVLVAFTLERQVDFDPFVVMTLGNKLKGSLYVTGQRRWDNDVTRKIDFPNPPLAQATTLVVVRVDGSGEMSLPIDVEAPAGMLRLPMENRLLGERLSDAQVRPDPDDAATAVAE